MQYNPDDPTRLWALRHSANFPMLYFQHAEDHGWSYNLFHNGQEKASVNATYGLSYYLWREIAERLYPDVDPPVELDSAISQQIEQQVLTSEQYQHELKAQYTNVHLENFAVFGLTSDEIAQLENIMPSNSEASIEQVVAFQRILGIKEMSWMSYDYLTRDASEDDFDE